MATPFRHLCRLTLLTTLLWTILTFFVLTGESNGAKTLSTSLSPSSVLNLTTNLNHCAEHITHYEKQHGIPEGLLHAISKVESGRKDDTGRIVAWPWTINANGQGYYFPTKEDAIVAVRKMQLKGISSIDIGCMQVNLFYHPDAFKTLNDAFDPAQNVAYAARFLKGLKNEHASWYRAVAHYHSANPIHHIPYQKNVMNVWNRDMKAGGVILAAGVFEERAQPKINRIRRWTSSKTLSLKKASFIPFSNKGTVRRVVGSNSSHIRRVHRKTLKVS